jgi:phytoene synthase
MPASDADFAACRELLSGGSRTFFAATYILPRSLSKPASALYAFCRLADDAVDVHGGRLAALDRLQERLDRAYSGRPLPNAVDRAFAETVAEHAIPRELPEALLEGLAWDARGRRYEDLGHLTEYAMRVAGSVGAMMSVLMGAREPYLVARACDLGVAMQFTNIARDVGEDARAGRLYLPLAWLRDEGIDPEAWLAKPAFSPELGGVVRRLLRQADTLYARSGAGIAALPWSCQPGIRAAALIYAEIGQEVERRGYDSISGRAVVDGRTKMKLMMQAALTSMAARGGDVASALPAAQTLIDAVAAAAPGHRARRQMSAGRLQRTFFARMLWLIDLFERLERRDRLERSSLSG